MRLCVCGSCASATAAAAAAAAKRARREQLLGRQAGPKAQSTSANKQYKQQRARSIRIDACMCVCVGVQIPMYSMYVCMCKYTDLTNCCAHTQKILNVYLSANNSHTHTRMRAMN